MPLSAAQRGQLATDIAANTNTIGGTAINALPHTQDNADAVAKWYSGVAVPDYFVLRTDVPVADLYDQVTWANFTPTDPVPTTPDLTVQVYMARALACQAKQFNLQTLLLGRTTFDATKVKQRAGLNDATTNIPSGTAGALTSGGWATILPILRRQAKWVERLFGAQTTGVGITATDPLGGTTNPALMGYEGDVPASDVRLIWGI